jgi:hypothetical protein
MIHKSVQTLLGLMIVLLCVGCSHKAESNYGTTISIGGFGSDNTYNDFGVFNAESGIVHFCDPETGLRTPICTKINCDHQGKSLSNPSPSCDAYFTTFINCIAVVGDHLYAVCSPEDEGLFVKEFIKSDRDGTNRKVLYRAEDICYFGSGIYENGYFVYSFYNQEDNNGNKLEKNKLGMIIINLDAEEVTRVNLEDAYEGKILTANVFGDDIYYMLSYVVEDLSMYDYDFMTSQEGIEKLRNASRVEIWKYNLKNGNTDLVDIRTSDNSSYWLGFGHILKGYDEDRKLELTDLKTGTVIWIDGEDLSYANVAMFDEGILFSKNGQIKLLRYGAEHLENIGSYKEKSLGVNWVTDRWVYGTVFTDDGGIKCVWPREEFFSGNMKWKVLNLRD